MEAVLRTITAEDWASFRDVRLKALADSPQAFGITHAEAMANAASVWQQRADGPGPVVVAYSGERPVAMGGLHAPADSSEAFVWGMWVEPDARGSGQGAEVLKELLAKAAQMDRPVLLHVTEGNDGARRLYERHGFVPTGEWQPLREGADVRIETMRKD